MPRKHHFLVKNDIEKAIFLLHGKQFLFIPNVYLLNRPKVSSSGGVTRLINKALV
jgi:hypothetical protein